MSDTSPAPQRCRTKAGIRPEHRALAVHGYWEAFSRKLRYPLGPERKALAFLEHVLNPSHAISAISPEGTFLGVAGFKTPQGAFIGGELQDLTRIYGLFSGTIRGLVLSMLERDCEPGVLLMDGLFVRPEARGLGVGSDLLAAVEDHAATNGLSHVRLDVIDTNPRARALYERKGFAAQAKVSMGPLRPVFGFATATTMTKAVA